CSSISRLPAARDTRRGLPVRYGSGFIVGVLFLCTVLEAAEHFDRIFRLSGSPCDGQRMATFQTDAQWLDEFGFRTVVSIERPSGNAIPTYGVPLAVYGGMATTRDQRCEPDGGRFPACLIRFHTCGPPATEVDV